MRGKDGWMAGPTSVKESHNTFWWKIKVVCGLLLILGVFDRYIFHLTGQLFSMAPIIPQCMVVLGGAISLTHYFFIKKQNSDISRPSALITRPGFFPWVRHPMYLGDMILYLGLYLLSPGYGTSVALVLSLVALYRQARVEDDYLLALFGGEFTDWVHRTGRVVPRIRKHQT